MPDTNSIQDIGQENEAAPQNPDQLLADMDILLESGEITDTDAFVSKYAKAQMESYQLRADRAYQMWNDLLPENGTQSSQDLIASRLCCDEMAAAERRKEELHRASYFLPQSTGRIARINMDRENDTYYSLARRIYKTNNRDAKQLLESELNKVYARSLTWTRIMLDDAKP